MKIDTELLERYNHPVPRYTSYPPANHFKLEFNEHEFIRLIEKSNKEKPENLSFYFHIPFCKKLCHYCGCNAYIARTTNQVERYFEALKQEIELVTSHIDPRRKISQIHFGGGTPNAVEAALLVELVDILRSKFETIEDAEIAIECHPALLTLEYVDIFKAGGFNRFSLGIQDFHDEVLKAVNRDPSRMDVKELIRYIKKDAPNIGVNLDFIYGLPLQTTDNFADTIAQAIEAKPDRVVTFSYAHVPWMKKQQVILEKRGLPDKDEKMGLFLKAHQLFSEAGYQSIGLDHFVLPEDELFVSLQKGSLHRNFQGYCTRRTTGQVYAFGVTAISQLNGGFSQNVKSIEEYIELAMSGHIPTERGYTLSDSDKVTAQVIGDIMCNLRIDWNMVAEEVGKSVQEVLTIVDYDPQKYDQMVADGIAIINDKGLEVTPQGAFFVRNVAATFDKFYKQQTGTYSKNV